MNGGGRLLRCLSARLNGVEELADHRGDAVRRLDELDPGPVEDELLVDVGDAAVGDASFDDDRSIAESEPEFVQGIELKGKAGFDLRAAAADLLDRHRLEDRDFAAQLAEDLDALGVALVLDPAHP